jgi:formate dehydrogenase formation protein
MVDDPWSPRIRRALVLADANTATASLLRFYGSLLQEQKKVYDALAATAVAGNVETDLDLVLSAGTGLLRTVADCGPAALATEARQMLDRGQSEWRRLALAYWSTRSDRLFFGKVLVQPYGECLARARNGPIAGFSAGDNRCPRCGGAPQVSVLEVADTADGSARRLQCASCLTAWEYRRILCPSCGNEDERTLAYYESPSFPHVRVDTCERCGRYIKTVDLRRLGLAVPLIDEVAAASLDIWASERGYEKIELNLVGL